MKSVKDQIKDALTKTLPRFLGADFTQDEIDNMVLNNLGRQSDYVKRDELATKTIDGWKATELPNGFKMCAKEVNVTITSWSAWGSVYESNQLLDYLYFPVTFSNVYAVIFKMTGVNDCGYEFTNNNERASGVRVLRPNNTLSVPNTGTLNVCVIGI